MQPNTNETPINTNDPNQVTGQASAQAPMPPAPQPAAAPVTYQPTPPPPVADPGMMAPPAVYPLTSNPKKRFMKIAVFVAAGLVVLLGGSAAAYLGVVVPNKPEHVLGKAFQNTITQDEVSIEGKLAYQSDSGGSTTAVDVSMQAGSSRSKKASKATVEVSTSGIRVPLELRLIDKDLFFKFGDLGDIKDLLATQLGSYASSLDQVEKKISNQWILVDNTLLKEAKLDCTLDAAYTTMTQEDVKALTDAYEANAFTTIKSSSGDTVNGKSTTKFDLEIDDNKLADYAKSVGDSSVFKALKACGEDSAASSAIDTSKLSDGDKTPLSVWVYKDTKRIAKITGKTTDADYQKDKIKGDVSFVFTYDPVNVEKPADAKSLVTLMSELQGIYSDLLGGSSTGLSGLQMSQFLKL